MQNIAQNIQPLVFGPDILGYSYVRELARGWGLRSRVLANQDVKFVSSSRFCDYQMIAGIDQEQPCMAYLREQAPVLAKQGKAGLLLGSGDWYARIFSANKPELEDLGYYVPYNDFALIDHITNKRNFYETCDELGLPYPKTVYVECAPDKRRSLDQVNRDLGQMAYPIVMKPANSALWHYADIPDKEKVYVVQTPQAASEILQNVWSSSYAAPLIVQECIPGADDALYTLTLFVGSDHKPRLAVSGRVVLEDHSPTALGNPVCIASHAAPQLLEQAAKLLDHIGYVGYANFDVKFDARDDTYKFFEVNTRPGRNSYYVSLAGTNFCAPIIDHYVAQNDAATYNASEPFLFTCVPARVVRESVADATLKASVLAAYRAAPTSPTACAAYPLYNPADTISHNFWSWLTYIHQISKFRRFAN